MSSHITLHHNEKNICFHKFFGECPTEQADILHSNKKPHQAIEASNPTENISSHRSSFSF